MGYISVVQIWNDELHRISDDPKKWAEELVYKLSGTPRPGDRLPGAKILRSEHADYDTLHLVGTGAIGGDKPLVYDRWDSLKDWSGTPEERTKAKQVRMLRMAAEELGFALTPTAGDSPLLGLNPAEKKWRMEAAGFKFEASTGFTFEGHPGDENRGYAMYSPKAPFARIALILKVKGGWKVLMELQIHDGQIRVPQGGEFRTLRDAKKAVYFHSDGILKDQKITDLTGFTKVAKKKGKSHVEAH